MKGPIPISDLHLLLSTALVLVAGGVSALLNLGYARTEAERWSVDRVDRGRWRLRLLPIDYLHDLEIVIEVSGRVGHFEDLAVNSSLLVPPLDLGACARGAVGKGPLVGELPAGSTP